MSRPAGRHLSQRGASPWIAMLSRGGRPFCAGSLLGKPILGEMLQEVKTRLGISCLWLGRIARCWEPPAHCCLGTPRLRCGAFELHHPA